MAYEKRNFDRAIPAHLLPVFGEYAELGDQLERMAAAASGESLTDEELGDQEARRQAALDRRAELREQLQSAGF